MTTTSAARFIQDFLRSQSIKCETRLLYRAVLFSGLSQVSLRMLFADSTVQEFAAEKEILRQGEVPKYLCCILNGCVKTLRHGLEGEETAIRMLSDGETFMDAVIFVGGPSPVSARTTEPTTLLMIPASIVRKLALADPQFAANLLKIVSRHYRNAIQQIGNLITQSPSERIGHYALNLHQDQGFESVQVDLSFQKSTIASHLGMTPETFSRSLGQLRKTGIEIQHNRITLKDPYSLCVFCNAEIASRCPMFSSPKCRFPHAPVDRQR